jgi:hypothetical protein
VVVVVEMVVETGEDVVLVVLLVVFAFSFVLANNNSTR